MSKTSATGWNSSAFEGQRRFEQPFLMSHQTSDNRPIIRDYVSLRGSVAVEPVVGAMIGEIPWRTHTPRPRNAAGTAPSPE